MHMNRLLKSLFFNFFRFGVVDDEGGGGGNAITPEVQAIIDAKISEAVTGLKSKNGELIGKLKEAGANLQRFDGIDPDAVRNILSKFASEEEAGLIAKGDIEAVMKKRTERMASDHEKQLKSSADTIAQLNAKAAKLAAGKVSAALTQAALKLGALPDAMRSIVLQGADDGWTINEAGDVVAMRDGEVVLSKDGKTALTTDEWVEGLRDSSPFMWPKAQGTGAMGSTGGNRQAPKGNLGGNKSDRVAAIASRFPELN